MQLKTLTADSDLRLPTDYFRVRHSAELLYDWQFTAKHFTKPLEAQSSLYLGEEGN
jgi:hypothetical protein